MRGYGLKSASGPRDLNEDTAFIKDFTARTRQIRYLCVGLVADGMGGHQAGEVASSEAVQSFFEMFNAKKIPYEQDLGMDTRNLIYDIFSSVNSAVYDIARRDNKLKGMGTTLTAFVAEKGAVTIGHVGDTRAYLIRKGSISQLTQDHTLVENMIRDGIITREQASARSDRNVITRAVGVEPTVEVDVFSVPVEPGDVIFVCSDGLYEAVSNHDILIRVSEAKTMQEACQELVRMAVDNGTTDNATAVAWEVPETAAPAAHAPRRKTDRDTVVLPPEGRGEIPLEDLETRRKRRMLAVSLLVLAVLLGFLLGWLLAGWVKGRDGGQGSETEGAELQSGVEEASREDLRSDTLVFLLNARGSRNDPAAKARARMEGLGYGGLSRGDAEYETRTQIFYGPGDREKAELVARDLGLGAAVPMKEDRSVVGKYAFRDLASVTESDVVVVLTDDWDIP